MIRVLTTLYNSEKYIPMTIQSLKLQKNKNWKCYITADLPTDNSIQVARDNIGDDSRFEIIENKEKQWQVGNYYNVLQKKEIDDEDICLTLDGDDWCVDENVFNRVEGYYKDKNIFLTYGQFVHYKGPGQYVQGFASPPSVGIKKQRTVAAFTTTHLRTFKAWLFRKIRKETLQDDNGNFIPMAGDLAFMWPMLEMCGDKHSKFTDDVNYVYNEETNLNEYKVNFQESERCANISRNREPYKELDI